MARPKYPGPTPAELEILRVLWRRGPSTVAEVLGELEREPKPAYTTVMSLLGVMYEKELVTRSPRGRAYVYTAKAREKTTLKKMVRDLVDRAFEGSAGDLVLHALEDQDVPPDELAEIQKLIREKKSDTGGK